MVRPLCHPQEYKVIALRECPTPDRLRFCQSPHEAADYWRLHIEQHPLFDPERECLAVLMLNTKRRVKGHQLLTIGTQDTLLVHPRDVFRAAIIASAASVVIMHNHPSGDPDPSAADISVTRTLVRVGRIIRIEVCDHIIMGRPSYASLGELGMGITRTYYRAA